MAELPSGEDLLGLSPREVLDGSGGSEDPEEAQQDQGGDVIICDFIEEMNSCVLEGHAHKISAFNVLMTAAILHE